MELGPSEALPLQQAGICLRVPAAPSPLPAPRGGRAAELRAPISPSNRRQQSPSPRRLCHETCRATARPRCHNPRVLPQRAAPACTGRGGCGQILAWWRGGGGVTPVAPRRLRASDCGCRGPALPRVSVAPLPSLGGCRARYEVAHKLLISASPCMYRKNLPVGVCTHMHPFRCVLRKHARLLTALVKWRGQSDFSSLQCLLTLLSPWYVFI